MQAAPDVQTPAWGGLATSSEPPEDTSGKDTAAPKTWRGQGEWQVCTHPTLLCLADPVLSAVPSAVYMTWTCCTRHA